MSEPEQDDDYQPSEGILYALVGIPLLVLGGMALSNLNETGMFGVIGLVLIGVGGYCIIVGAVARGIQLSRK